MESLKAIRSSNWEVLRIIAMILIIGHHIALYSSFGAGNELSEINKYWILFIEGGGKIGANIFFLLSGYFLVSVKKWNKEKIIKIISQIWFYSIAIFCIFLSLDLIQFDWKLLLQALCPIAYSTWWFASAYFLLYLVFPFINIMIENMREEKYRQLLVIATICFSVIPTFLNQTFQCNGFIWAIYLYLLGGYIKINISEKLIKLKINLVFLIIAIGITYILTVILVKVPICIEAVGVNRKQFYDMQSILVLVISVLFIIVFMKIKINKSKIINRISMTTFGIYLIHENPYIREILYSNIFNNKKYSNSSGLILYIVFEIICIFIGGILIFSITIPPINIHIISNTI